MDDSLFRIAIKGTGIDVDKSVPESVVYRVLQILLEAGDEVRQKEAGSFAEGEMRRSLRRAFERHRPTNNQERIGLVVGFVERAMERPASRDEIQDWLVVADEPLPSNFSRDVNLAVEKQLIEGSHGQDGVEQYRLGPAGKRRFPRPEEMGTRPATFLTPDELERALDQRTRHIMERHGRPGTQRKTK